MRPPVRLTVVPVSARPRSDTANTAAGTGGEVWAPLLSAGGTSAALSPGATLLRRSGNYDVCLVGAGTFEFSFTP